MIKNCETCGAEIHVYPSTAARKRFCSKKCLSDWQSKNMSGENSVHWKGGPTASMDRESKVCSKCGEEKPMRMFQRRSDGGPKPECKACSAEMSKRYAAAHKAELRAKQAEYARANRDRLIEARRQRRKDNPEERTAQHYRKAYGMTLQQVDAMIASQGGRCACCGDILLPGHKTHVDHDHVTGQVRGVLCRWCNLAEGNLKGSALRAEKLAAYLRRNAPALKLVADGGSK